MMPLTLLLTRATAPRLHPRVSAGILVAADSLPSCKATVLHMCSKGSHDVSNLVELLPQILGVAMQVSPTQIRDRLDSYSVRCSCMPSTGRETGTYPQVKRLIHCAPRRMQVTPRPKQPNNWDCGLFVGLQAEVICRNLEGIVQRQGTELVCDGPNGHFLAEDKDWFTMNDVRAARLLLRAACTSLWEDQFPSKYADMSAESVEARQDLLKASNRSLPTEDGLWYFSLQRL